MHRPKASPSLLTFLTSLALVVALAAFNPTSSSATTAADAAQASSAAATSKATKKALKTLVKQTGKLSKKAVKGTSRARLIALSKAAQRHAAKESCTAVKELSTYRKTLKGTKVKKKPKKLAKKTLNRLAGLNAASTRASILLLGSKKTKKCGGGVAPSKLTEAQTSVTEVTETHMKLKVRLPLVNTLAERKGGKTFTKLVVPDAVNPGNPGEPGIPVVNELFGVPNNAQLDVDVLSSKSITVDDVQLFPTQPEPVDNEPEPNFNAPPFNEAPFVGETVKKGTFPASPADGQVLGTSRDLRIGQLDLATAQYKPKKDKLKIFTEIVVDVKFPGGTGFDPDGGSPWELAASKLRGGLLNSAIIKNRPYLPRFCGEELLVLTVRANLAQANAYKNARVADGFLTRTEFTDGMTAVQIRDLIRSHVNSTTCIRPSYVTIIGDDEFVPTWTAGPGGIPSDNPYSTKDDADELPDVAVGRILGNTQAELDAFINKINYYQDTPQTEAMRTKAGIAAQFQDTDEAGEVNDGQEDRTFIWFAETARKGLMKKVVTVDRIYDDSPATNPLKFNDGTDLPAELKKPTFAWDGDGADVTAAWNAGRFLMVHRDHGWSDGWGHPHFTTTEVNALTNTNDQLPVLMSINCSSAQYDLDETSFVQQALVKPTGGAVAAFGDTRDSPSWHNSQIGLGFLDGLLPHVLAGEGPAAKLRVGDALVHGKLRLAGLAPPSGPGIVGGSGSTRNELYLWHLFGDPTMKMFGGDKPFIVFNPKEFTAIYKAPIVIGPGPYTVELTLPKPLPGEMITLVRKTANGASDVVGKVVGDGSTKLVIPSQLDPNGLETGDSLEVVVNADDANAVPIDVTGEPQPVP